MRAVWKVESDLCGWIDIQVRVESEDRIAVLGEQPYADHPGVVMMRGNVWVAPSADDGPSYVGEAEAGKASRMGKIGWNSMTIVEERCADVTDRRFPGSDSVGLGGVAEKLADVMGGFQDVGSGEDTDPTSDVVASPGWPLWPLWLVDERPGFTTTYSQWKPFLLQYAQGFVGGCSESRKTALRTWLSHLLCVADAFSLFGRCLRDKFNELPAPALSRLVLSVFSTGFCWNPLKIQQHITISTEDAEYYWIPMVSTGRPQGYVPEESMFSVVGQQNTFKSSELRRGDGGNLQRFDETVPSTVCQWPPVSTGGPRRPPANLLPPGILQQITH
ncbi:hypothetical protein DFH08DRAFT_814053 [Mycena albidolilacea]|uniref:Uncharacterized protein n=1 Tax=Mycena albidolilacea TaxID=1033008 RepID=A0AAD6ZQI1_9AGAR|nr:hypothetical protein DFH08DRAFT_814053 [Mycena albidolilacea]